MKYTEENPPVCKCGCKMQLQQEALIIPSYFWVCVSRNLFNFWKHTAAFASEYGYQ